MTRASNKAVNPEPGSAQGTFNGQDAVLRALDAWQVGDEQRLVLAGIQMPPLSLALVVPGGDGPAFWAEEFGPGFLLDKHADFAGSQGKVDIGYHPGRPDAKNLCVKVCIFHAPNFNLPTRFGEEPKYPNGDNTKNRLHLEDLKEKINHLFTFGYLAYPLHINKLTLLNHHMAHGTIPKFSAQLNSREDKSSPRSRPKTEDCSLVLRFFSVL